MKLVMLRVCFIAILSGLLSACGASFEASPESVVTKSEDPYCGTAKTISGGTITVTGNAQFKSRKLTYSGSTWYLDYTFNTTAIAYAEIHVYDSSANLIQCGETDGSGNISVLIPSTANKQYILYVYSRASNNYYKVSVLNDINSNTPYNISKSFSSGSGSSVSIGTLTAQADESLDSSIAGGAFNIMNDVLKANNFLRAQTSSFTVAPKVTAYWKAGFNPNTYRGGSATSGISFYVPGTSSLYILGGINGNVKTSDTDHFDDSVVMHEYGHFLEDIYGESNSPGGSHNGNSIIDPRLAWSEGWANYIQAAIKTYIDSTDSSKSLYIDTYGYKQSSSATSGFGQNVVFDMTADPTNASSYDNPGYAAEGMFREVSVSRTLYKTTSPTSVTYTYNGTSGKPSINIPFSYVWRVFSDGDSTTSPAQNGFHSSSVYFRSMGLFNYLLNTLITLHQADDSSTYSKLSSWTTMLGEEYQPTNNLEYGANLASGTCSDTTIQAVRNITTNKAVACAPIGSSTCSSYAYASNQLRSNDFYRYCYTGSNPNLTLTVTTAGSSTLNINVYSESYVYFEEIFALAGQSSSSLLRSASISTTGTRTVSLSGLANGCYMVNIKVGTANSDGTDKSTAQLASSWQYNLRNDGGQLCPQTP